MAKYIKVRSGRTDDRVVLFEKDPRHPNGEAFVAGKGVKEVAETPLVLAQLSKGQLVRAGEGEDETNVVNTPLETLPGQADIEATVAAAAFTPRRKKH
jgi:hypothetical protein